MLFKSMGAGDRTVRSYSPITGLPITTLPGSVPTTSGIRLDAPPGTVLKTDAYSKAPAAGLSPYKMESLLYWQLNFQYCLMDYKKKFDSGKYDPLTSEILSGKKTLQSVLDDGTLKQEQKDKIKAEIEAVNKMVIENYGMYMRDKDTGEIKDDLIAAFIKVAITKDQAALQIGLESVYSSLEITKERIKTEMDYWAYILQSLKESIALAKCNS